MVEEEDIQFEWRTRRGVGGGGDMHGGGRY